MSTTAKEAKARKSAELIQKARAEGKRIPKLEVRHRNRCLRCGRARGYMRKLRSAACASATWRCRATSPA